MAMKIVVIPEVEDDISEALNAVEQGETVGVARHGHIIASLVPTRRCRRTQREIDEIIAEMDRVAAELSARWPAGVTVEEAIEDVRS